MLITIVMQITYVVALAGTNNENTKPVFDNSPTSVGQILQLLKQLGTYHKSMRR